MFTAELGIDGQLHPIKNVISYAIEAARHGLTGIVVPPENKRELSSLQRIDPSALNHLKILSFHKLSEVIDWIYGLEPMLQSCGLEQNPEAEQAPSAGSNFNDMLLNPELSKLALVVATGFHSLFLYGAPGTGKSMFSARLQSIFPPLDKNTHLEVLKIHSSFSAKIPSCLFKGSPPFRAPHHQASAAAVLGVPENPGEISLAHGGILFLDEFPEFRRDIIESLREPLETGMVHISRAKHKVCWKAKIVLLAACNLCPCGWYGSTKKRCMCPTQKILSYRRKIAGPVVDRIDLHVNLFEKKINQTSLFLQLNKAKNESKHTESMRIKVQTAREFSQKRNKDWGILHNSEIAPIHLMEASKLDQVEFSNIVNKYIPTNISQRSLIRSLRIARTLADIDLRDKINEEDIAAAVSWQPEVAGKKRGDAALGLM